MKQRFFNPYVGPEYACGFRNGKKVLVVGASHYCTHDGNREELCPFWHECTSLEKRDSSRFNDCCPFYSGIKLEDTTLTEVEESFENKDYKSYNTFAKFLCDYFDEESTSAAWQRVAFVNYVQFFLPTITTPALGTADIVCFEALLETITELEPDIIIVWGCRVSKHFKIPGVKEHVELLALRDNDYLWDLKHNGKSYIILNPYHPSSSRWHSGKDYFHNLFNGLLNT